MKMNDKATAERIAREKAEALEISKKLRAMTLVVKAKGGGGNTATAGAQLQNSTIKEALDRLVASIDQFYEE